MIATSYRIARRTVIAFTFLFAIPLAAQENSLAVSARLLAARVDSVGALIKTLDAQIAVPTPKTLSRTDVAQWNAHTEWLQKVRTNYSTVIPRLCELRDGAKRGANVVDDIDMFEDDFLALQSATQTESRSFKPTTSILRTRHDTIKNSLNNIR